ncbi:MAG: hypothetical protein QG597_4643, partial [Actinomycetota bacterium]|nr:hypothetical protein [Actinomycetota bacterium]
MCAVFVAGSRQVALCDTGADFGVMAPELARELALPFEAPPPDRDRAQLADRRVIEVTRWVTTTLALDPEGPAHPAGFAVIQREAKGETSPRITLGTDALQSLGLLIWHDEDHWELKLPGEKREVTGCGAPGRVGGQTGPTLRKGTPTPAQLQVLFTAGG